MSNVAMMLGEIDRRLLNEFQHDFPLDPQPFATIAEELGTDEQTVLERLSYLKRFGALSRVGAVLRPNRVGASTLAALAVPPGTAGGGCSAGQCVCRGQPQLRTRARIQPVVRHYRSRQ